jgi:hypothetical protein
MKIGKIIGYAILAIMALILVYAPQTLMLVWYKLFGSETQKKAAEDAKKALDVLGSVK